MYDTLYEPAFRSLLWRVRARRLQVGVDLLLNKAQSRIRAEAGGETRSDYQQVYQRARAQTIRQLVRGREAKRCTASGRGLDLLSRSAMDTERLLETSIVLDPATVVAPGDTPADFHCDAGLGGMARWLRAAGYDARFFPGIDDDELLRVTIASCAILLTTDGPLMDRAALRWGAVPGLLVPLTGGKQTQFRFVAERLGLPIKRPRCMACGGPLLAVDKEANRQRIPPRTYPWCDEYFECGRCRKLFWPGTHWQRVTRSLDGGSTSDRDA